MVGCFSADMNAVVVSNSVRIGIRVETVSKSSDDGIAAHKIIGVFWSGLSRMLSITGRNF